LLSIDNLSYASTAQTIGLNTGYFLSFTVFLAFNSPEFANKYFRSVPTDEGLVSFGGYLKFWGWMYILVTIWLAKYKKEVLPQLTELTLGTDSNRGRRGKSSILNDLVNHETASYQPILSDCLTVDVRTLMIVLLLSKFGFQANEAVTNLKLLEKGFSREDLALTVLIDFPFSILFGYYAAKWSTGPTPLRPWMLAWVGRLLSALLNMALVSMFPKSGVGIIYFILVIIGHVATSFMRYDLNDVY
jgi:MFS transporter, PAT family, solute carrier family 33 (acetyl-CoA transportor), member 1